MTLLDINTPAITASASDGWNLIPGLDDVAITVAVPSYPPAQQVTGNTGTRLIRRFDPPLTEANLVLEAELLVRSGRILLTATKGLNDSPTLIADPSPVWQRLSLPVQGPVDQAVVYLAADGSDASIRALTCTPRQPSRTAQPAGTELEPVRPLAASTADEPASAPPLAALDLRGPGTVIAYQLPESVSYAGHHVLGLDYPVTAFASVVNAADSDNTSPQPATPAAATAQVPLRRSVTAPSAVLLSDESDGSPPVVKLAPYPLSGRLDKLIWSDVAVAAGAGKRVDIYRSIGGSLDYRLHDDSSAGRTGSTVTPSTIRPADVPRDPDPGSGGGDHGLPSVPTLTLSISSPTSSSGPVTGPWNGLQLPITGQAFADVAGAVSVAVTLADNTGTVVARADAVLDSSSTWHAVVAVVKSGQYTVTATGSAAVRSTRITNATAAIIVLLDSDSNSQPPPPPVIVPMVTIDSPQPRSVLSDPDGRVQLSITGTVDPRGGPAVSVHVSVDGAPAFTVPLVSDPAGTGKGLIATTAVVVGQGAHQLIVTAANSAGAVAPAVVIPFSIMADQPVVPIERRLFLIQRLAITSYLGNFGAGRVVKTFTLLPGEQTTITVETYMKDDETRQRASSILESCSDESADDFENTIQDSNEHKDATQNTVQLSVSGQVGIGWGFGSASISGGVSSDAMWSLGNTVATVRDSLAKHTRKASNNRTMTVNTEYTSDVGTGNTTDTTRTLKNINVARVLNFVFRQLNQEHHTFVSLTGATLGYYALDELVDAAGDPLPGDDGGPQTRETFTEYTLPELGAFARGFLSPAAGDSLPGDVLGVLGSVSDYQSVLQSLVEVVTPEDATGQHPDQQYLRVKPGLTQTYVDPATGASLEVPGIILGHDTFVLRTDQVICDAVLGEGDALDSYSHALQDVTIAERQAQMAAVNAATAREQLAQAIIAGKDADMAALWHQIYPQPLSVPATITVPGAGTTSTIDPLTGL